MPAKKMESNEHRKQALISEMVSARNEILEVVSRIEASLLDEIFLGEWSVKDLFAHPVGWNHSNTGRQ